MNTSSGVNSSSNQPATKKTNQNIQVYVRVRPMNARERGLRSAEVIDVISPREIVTRHTFESKLTKKFTFDRTFGQDSRQVEVYSTVVAPLIEEVLSGYNCTVFAYGQTGTGKTHTMVGTECAELKSSWEDDSEIGIIPRALSHLFDELRLMEMEFSMRISYLELYNEELCDLLSSDDSTKIRIFDDSTKKGSVIIQGLEEIPVHSKDDVYKLLEKGKERRKTATTLMNAQSSRSHTVFSILVHIRENGIDGEEMLKIGKLNLVDLAGSENVSKAGNEKGVRVRETVNINQSLLTLGRVITALVERTPHIPYRESKLTRLLQESLGGRTKTSIIATISPGHKDIDETLSTLEYAHRAKNIQNKPEVNQKLTKKTVLKEYTEEIDKLKRDLMAARDKNGIYLAEDTYNEMTLKMDSQNRELNEKMLLLKALKDELQNKEKIFNEVSLHLVQKTEALLRTEENLNKTKGALQQTTKILTNTKKRYKEKKVLLDSHVKTEEVLTTQAAQILEVADLATNDTHKLHTTIERRKDVDIKIQTACERFTERMRENFNLMNENLHQLQEKHKSHSLVIVDEFKNTTSLQSELLNDANRNINNLKAVCNNSLASMSALSEKYRTTMSGLSAEHQNCLAKLFEELRKKEHEVKLQIETNLCELESNNDKIMTAMDKGSKRIGYYLQRSTADLEAHTATVQQQIGEVVKIADMNKKEFEQCEKAIAVEHRLASEEANILQEFVEKMNSLREERMTQAGGVRQALAELSRNNARTIERLEESANCSAAFCQQQREASAAEQQHIKQDAAAVLLCTDHTVVKCSTLHMLVDNIVQESSKRIDALVAAEHSQHALMLETNAKHAAELANERNANEQKVASGCVDAKRVIAEDIEKLKRKVAVIEGLSTSLAGFVDEYGGIYEDQMGNCDRTVHNFQQSELQTYVPTGATPSKRDFVYPRVLAATSPHNQIVKRLRQENDWSDLDITAIIDEGSENDEESAIGEQSSVRDVSDAETILNSTPIDSSEALSVQVKRGSVNGSGKSANLLKQPPYLRTASPRKPSPRNSPAYLKENKENVS